MVEVASEPKTNATSERPAAMLAGQFGDQVLRALAANHFQDRAGGSAPIRLATDRG